MFCYGEHDFTPAFIEVWDTNWSWNNFIINYSSLCMCSHIWSLVIAWGVMLFKLRWGLSEIIWLVYSFIINFATLYLFFDGRFQSLPQNHAVWFFFINFEEHLFDVIFSVIHFISSSIVSIFQIRWILLYFRVACVWIHTCRRAIGQHQSRMMKHVPKWFHDHLVSNNSIISGSGKSCSSLTRHNLSSFCFVAKSDNPKWLFDTTFCVVFIKTVSLFSWSLCSFVSPRYRVW